MLKNESERGVIAVNRDEIMDAIKMLASSQGFYSRMYSSLCEMRDNDPDEFDRNMTILEEQNFGDAVDMAMFFET